MPTATKQPITEWSPASDIRPEIARRSNGEPEPSCVRAAVGGLETRRVDGKSHDDPFWQAEFPPPLVKGVERLQIWHRTPHRSRAGTGGRQRTDGLRDVWLPTERAARSPLRASSAAVGSRPVAWVTPATGVPLAKPAPGRQHHQGRHNPPEVLPRVVLGFVGRVVPSLRANP
jgi:hypothetical protein